MIILFFVYLISISQIILYFLHSTSVLAFYINLVLTRFIIRYSKNEYHILLISSNERRGLSFHVRLSVAFICLSVKASWKTNERILMISPRTIRNIFSDVTLYSLNIEFLSFFVRRNLCLLVTLWTWLNIWVIFFRKAGWGMGMGVGWGSWGGGWVEQTGWRLAKLFQAPHTRARFLSPFQLA